MRMQVKQWGVRLMLGAVLFAGVLACNISDTLIAQTKPTTIPTRTPRPTFTPLPPPSPTVAPTVVVATKPPTARPATARPPTAKPVVVPTSPPPPPAQPTTPQFRYKSANKGCEHSGQTFIQGTVYSGQSPIGGVMICMAGDPGGPCATTRESGTDGDGFYSMIVNAAGHAAGQKRWVWVIENGQRVSDIVEFQFNNLKPDQPGVCWRGFVDFVQQY